MEEDCVLWNEEDEETEEEAAMLRRRDDRDQETAATETSRNGCIIKTDGTSYLPQTDNGHRPLQRKLAKTDSPDWPRVVQEMSEPLESRDSVLTLPEHPPSYENATEDDATDDENHTDIKRVISEGDTKCDDTREKFVPDDDDDDEIEQTDVKTPMPDNEMAYWQERLETLTREQEELRRKQEEHEERIQELMKRERFRSFRRSLSGDTDKKSLVSGSTVSTATSFTKGMQKMILSEDRIYVQLEQLYQNLQILHFPAKTLKGLVREPTYYQVNSVQDFSAMMEENASLKKENQQLQEQLQEQTRKLKELQRTPGPPPPPRHHLLDTPHITNERPKSPATARRPQFVPGRPHPPQPIPTTPVDLRPMEVTFKWVITDYTNKLRQHKIREGTRETSSPFYITHCGYRAHMEAYLNGNGSGTGRCMSVFLRVVKGDYDRHLKWPVNLHMQVILVNQTDTNSNSLKAGENHFQYKQPNGSSDNESDSWGLVEFVSHDMIRSHSYILNDRIVLKCKIQLFY